MAEITDACALEVMRLRRERFVKPVDSCEGKGWIYSSVDYLSSEKLQGMQCRGVVIEQLDNGEERLVFKGFPFNVDVNMENYETRIDEIDQLIGGMKNCVFLRALEGTLIRVFHMAGKWRTSTTRKFDAFRSRWVSPMNASFGKTFCKAMMNECYYEYDENTLTEEDMKEWLQTFYENNFNKDVSYVFMVLPTREERRVVDASTQPTALLVATFDVCHVPHFDEEVYVKHERKNTIDDSMVTNGHFLPRNGQLFEGSQHEKTLKDYCDWVTNECDWKKYQGVMAFNVVTGMAYKFGNATYDRYAKARGNVPSLRATYLRLRRPENAQMLNDFKVLFPDFDNCVQDIEKEIYKLQKILYEKYQDKYVRTHLPIIPYDTKRPICKNSKDETEALDLIHRQYILSKRQPTNLQTVGYVMATQDFGEFLLNHLLTAMKRRETVEKKVQLIKADTSMEVGC